MEDLRIFLESRPRLIQHEDGVAARQELFSKLRELRNQNSILHYSSAQDIHRLSNEKLLEALNKLTENAQPCRGSALPVCIEALKRVCEASQPPHAILQLSIIPLANAVIDNLNSLLSKKSFLPSYFCKEFLKIKSPCPLQLLWKLHTAGIMQISTYVCYKSQLPKSEGTHLSTALFWLLTSSTEFSCYSGMVNNVLAALLVMSQPGPLGIGQQLSSSCVTLVQDFTEQVVEWLLDEQPDNSVSLSLSYLSSKELQQVCGDEAVRWCALTHLLSLLSQRAVTSSEEALCDAVKNQNKTWVLENTPSSLKDLISMVVYILGVEEIVRLLHGAVVKPKLNWRIILLTTATLVTAFPEAAENLEGMIEELLRRGLEGGRQAELSAAFLLARQCCHSKCPNFPSYSMWFSSHFGPNSSTARSQIQFEFLLQVLRCILPVESADTLRVHLNKVPAAPTNCNDMLHDYTTLAKTRMMDLNESTELTSLFTDSEQNFHSGKDLLQADIVRVLQHYQQTQEVMRPVLEASIFRRPYYQKIFLVELLGLPGSSGKLNDEYLSSFNLDLNVCHQLILKLKEKDKIPIKMFKGYSERICQGSNDDKEQKDSDVKTEKASTSKQECIRVVPKKRSLHVKQKKK